MSQSIFREGEIVLGSIQQTDGKRKLRPVLVLKILQEPFNDLLVCGMSTKLHLEVEGFDEIIEANDSDFEKSGLTASTLIWLGFISTLSSYDIDKTIGSVNSGRYERLLRRLSAFLLTGTS
jgi:mRNA interferase MazF